MRPMFAVPIALLFLSAGILAWMNPETVSSWIDDTSSSDSDDHSLIGLQTSEKWLVIVVDFEEHPAAPGLDVKQAENMLTGTNGVQEYLEQLSGGTVQLNLTIYQEVVRAEHSVEYYGSDANGDRDVGLSKEGSNGPSTLAEQVVNELSDVLEWENWDLDGDKVVDRLVILHTSRPQEDSGGSNKIWSHFGPMSESINVGDGMIVDHYTMASFRSSNYRGTIIHEALHQSGAIDLYAVHDVVRKDPWNGVGDWDIMASGNWNGGGATPGLPMAATIEKLGVDRHQTLPENWPEPVSCTQQLISVEPQSQGGHSLKIELSDGEYLWAEYRSNSGFDAQLPGEGLLLSIQDNNVGDLDDNDANTDSRHPYLRVVEADQDNGLISGTDDGSSGDLFQVGDVFGNDGVQIWNRFGFLVSWRATLEYDLSGVILNISSPDCSPTFDVETPGSEVVLIGNQTIPLYWNVTHSCEPTINLSSSDGREISAQVISQVAYPGEEFNMQLMWGEETDAGSKGELSGTLSCGTGAPYYVSISWYSVGNIPSKTEFLGDIPYSEQSLIKIPLELVGDGDAIYSVEVEGALSRIASSENTLNTRDTENVVLSISPNGLMSPGMIARGEIILSDENGIEYQINVTLTAESSSGSGWLDFLQDSGNVFLIIGVLSACWVLLGIRKEDQVEETKYNSVDTIETFSGHGPPHQN